VNDFEVVGTRGFFRPHGEITFEQGIELLVQSIRHARALGLLDLVMNTLGLTGFQHPGVFDRYALTTQCAQSAGAALRLVFVARPELIDFQKIGVLIAQNRGTIADIFASETEALAWLDSGRPPRDRLPEFEPGSQRTD
jgi:hypothetical protein